MFWLKYLIRVAAILIPLIMLQGCSTMSHFDGASPGIMLSLSENKDIKLPKDLKIDSKATGQHFFMAKSSNGEVMYGLLPLRVNGTAMAGSILLFAPALFIGGFRDAYPFYQLDPDAGLIRVKMKEQDEWRLSKPTTAESERAKIFFDKIGTKCTDTQLKCDTRTK